MARAYRERTMDIQLLWFYEHTHIYIYIYRTKGSLDQECIIWTWQSCSLWILVETELYALKGLTVRGTNATEYIGNFTALHIKVALEIGSSLFSSRIVLE